MLRFLPLLIFVFSACSQKLPAFKASDQPQAPDYANQQYWSALPFREDAADAIPAGESWIADSLKQVDVFYIYPTLYQNGHTWNADVDDRRLNKRLDKLPVKYQASVFNHVGRVYAPRYRQAIYASFEDTTGNGKAALDFAYTDVKNAFQYYLDNYNAERPIIIASHSQGTYHARQLLKDFFDTPAMQKKLVCAYIPGFAIYPEQYAVLTPCTDAGATGCYVTWASFKDGYIYDGPLDLYGKVCINPISWTMDTLSVKGQGGILLNMDKKNPFSTEARIHNNYLWVKNNMPLARHWKVLHLADFNLFWWEIRSNAEKRVNSYLK